MHEMSMLRMLDAIVKSAKTHFPLLEPSSRHHRIINCVELLLLVKFARMGRCTHGHEPGVTSGSSKNMHHTHGQPIPVEPSKTLFKSCGL